MNDVRSLTIAIAAGDADAFARFYRSHFDWMYAEARRSTGRDEAFCLDVVQDAMLRLLRSIKPFNSEPQLRAWLRSLVRSCAIDRLRAEARRRWREQAFGGEPRVPARVDEASEQLLWLRGALAALPASSAELLLSRYARGLSLREVGAARGLSIGAVDARIRRVLDALRRSAREYFHDH